MDTISSRDRVDQPSRPKSATGMLMNVVSLLDGVSRDLNVDEAAARIAIEKSCVLLREVFEPANHGDPPAQARLLAWQVRKVLDYIDSNINARMQVAELAGVIQKSQAHFSRMFKLTLARSPHAYVTERRVELARRLMLASDAALSDIAAQCGFADQSHMCRSFRRLTGRTPAAWRRERSSDHSPNQVIQPRRMSA